MRTIGNWKNDGNGKYIKQVQTQLGSLAEDVEAYAEEKSVSSSNILREIWGWVLKSDLEVSMVRINPDSNRNTRLIGVSVTQEMFDTIEEVRGTIPRGTFLRAITAAGLKASRGEE